MMAAANVEAADHYADATRAAGQAQGQASLVSGFEGVGSVLGGVINNMYGGGSMPGAQSIGRAATGSFDFSPYSSGMDMSGATAIGAAGNYGSSFGSSYFS
tara:strand:- start:463 stop:765 length:303 start_codon:yes stop_codon:yes gene_type:complete